MADAQYVIDIAANMGDGEKTAAQLDELTSTLQGAGKGAEFFSEAIATSSNDLAAARDAAASAASALAESNAEFSRLERSALQLARAADKTAQRFGAESTEARNAAAAAAAAKVAVDAHAESLRRLETEAADAATAEKRLGAQLKNVRTLAAHTDKQFAGSAESLGKVQGALSAVGGPLGRVGNIALGPQKAFAELSGTMGAANARMLLVAAGSAIVVAAVAAITVAAIAGAIAIAKWAVGLADAARASRLASDAAYALDPALASMRGTIESTASATNTSEEAVRGLAKQLSDAHVAAADMPGALRAAALAESALGAGGGAKFLDELKQGKRSAAELSAEFEGKLGPIVAQQMRGVGVATDRAGKKFGALFSGLDTEPVMRAMDRLNESLDESSAIGGTIKFLFEEIFQPLIDGAEKAYTFVEAFAIGALIELTKFYISIKPLIAKVKELFGMDDDTTSHTLATLEELGGLVARTLLYVGAVLAVPIAAFLALAAAVGVALTGLMVIVDTLVDVGRWLVEGLVNGITSMGPAILDALVGGVKNAVNAAKKFLGIASPSKLMLEIGGYVGEGYVNGIEAENDNAADATVALAEPPVSAMRQAGAKSAGAAGAAAKASRVVDLADGSGPSTVIDLRGAQITFQGVKDAPTAIGAFGELLTRAIEGDVVALGGSAA